MHVGVLVLDTAIPGVLQRHGDFGDNTVALLLQCVYPLEKYYLVGTEHQLVLAQVERGIDAGTIKALVLTGSRTDAFAQGIPWLDALGEFLKNVFARANFPIVGFCFGHQIMARVLGCKVGRNDAGWEAGTTTVALNRSVFEVDKSPFTHMEVGGTLLEHVNLVQVHQDVVYGLPAGAKAGLAAQTMFQNIGSTSKCSIQGFITERGPLKILTFQGHPEFSTAEALEILAFELEQGHIDRALYEKLKYKTETLANQGALMGRVVEAFIAAHS